MKKAEKSDDPPNAPLPPSQNMSISVNFTVHIPGIKPWEYAFVVGEHEELGAWMPEKALEMKPDPENRTIWHGSIILTREDSRHMLKFRYFTGYYLQGTQERSSKIRILHKWESRRFPRYILPAVEARNGTCDTRVDEFGFYGGKNLIIDGWLHNQCLKEIYLYVHGRALKFFKQKYEQRTHFIKIMPFDLRYTEVTSDEGDHEDGPDSTSYLPDLPSFSNCEIAVLTRGDPNYRPQSITGEAFRNNEDYFIFRTQTVACDNLAFRIELYSTKRLDSVSELSELENCDPKSLNGLDIDPRKLERVAITYCLPTNLTDTSGHTNVTILSKSQKPIGQLRLSFLFIKAMRPDYILTMERSWARHWTKRGTLEAGHRGMGDSYTKAASTRENTIASLDRAAHQGADFVEFDVQLTKDKIPVIYHDFYVLVSVARKSSSMRDLTKWSNSNLKDLSEQDGKHASAQSTVSSAQSSLGEYHQLAVKDLTLEQLHMLHLEYYRAIDEDFKGHLKVTNDDDEDPNNWPFPKLIEVLDKVDQHVGFNIEIKYPMRMADGQDECSLYFERNEYVDIILNEVFKHSKNRRIIFSSFDPDICMLIARKQNLFPVLYLTVGETKRYVPFMDPRSQSSSMSVNFAVGSNLLGVNFHSEDLLRDSSPVKQAEELGLISFVWGDDLDDHKNIDYFKKILKVDGIIYDRIGEFQKRRNVFIVEKETRDQLFRSRSPSRTTSVEDPRLIQEVQKFGLMLPIDRRNPHERRTSAGGSNEI